MSKMRESYRNTVRLVFWISGILLCALIAKAYPTTTWRILAGACGTFCAYNLWRRLLIIAGIWRE